MDDNRKYLQAKNFPISIPKMVGGGTGADPDPALFTLVDKHVPIKRSALFNELVKPLCSPSIGLVTLSSQLRVTHSASACAFPP